MAKYGIQTYLYTALQFLDAIQHHSTCVNSRALASGSRVKIAGLPERLRVYEIPENLKNGYEFRYT